VVFGLITCSALGGPCNALRKLDAAYYRK